MTDSFRWAITEAGRLKQAAGEARYLAELVSFAASYELIRTWKQGEFELRVYDTLDFDRHGKQRLAYELLDNYWTPSIVFRGDDFHASPLHAIDSDEAVAAILGFLSLRPGDTDIEFFERYSEVQLAWRDARAEMLAMIVFEMQERGDD